MPSNREHIQYCLRKGVSHEASEFANKLVDYPETCLPEILKTSGLKKFLGETLGSNWEEFAHVVSVGMIEERHFPVSHGIVHGIHKGNVELTKNYKRLLEEIVGYFYGDEGKNAVQLHFELDEVEHVTHELSLYLMQGIKGTTYIQSERRYLPNSNILRIAIGQRDIYTILCLVKASKNVEHIRELMKKQSNVVPEKTFGEVIDELEELRWLKPLKEL